MNSLFPFTAIVGQELMKQALILNAVNPGIGGVLIRGEKGTAKSTLARALAELLPEISVIPGCPLQCDPAAPLAQCPHCGSGQAQPPILRRMRVINLPANATEDRVVGSLDIEQALKSGQRRFEPGVLAEAHRGILYIDEVNLLDDHLIDLLLDAAAMGVNTVEREGVSFSHPARFILIGTMNPEEGEVRPQLLDRFGLCVEAQAIMDAASRTEIIRRRIAWEKDGSGFAARFAGEQQRLAAAITAARDLLPAVSADDALLDRAAQACIELDIRSHRADIVMVRAALTLAAFDGRRQATADDLRQAALLALPHRLRRRPFEESRIDPDTIAQALAGGEKKPSQTQAGGLPAAQPSEAAQEQVFEIARLPAHCLPSPAAPRKTLRAAGKKAKPVAAANRGKYTRSGMPAGVFSGSDIAVDATLRAAAPDQCGRKEGDPLHIASGHMRVKKRRRPAGATILFVVDASGSMAAGRRMAAAKGAVLSLLQDAYVQRNRVALIAFRDDGAEVLLPPTDNIDAAHEQLKDLPTGGRTPLAHGLARALELARQTRQRDAGRHLMAVLISDGKANVAFGAPASASPFDEASGLALQLVQAGIELLVLDTEDDFLALGLAKKLAGAAGAAYLKLARVEAGAVESAVRGQLQKEIV
ncbi:MAG: VWA domain-containing protein [Deltaproteobacteria bacterium]|nr:VWA domain-containing protein [Deltaproteobacteria bacterium]